MSAWVEEFPVAITVCDTDGVIVEMNERSRAMFARDGGGLLMGRNVLDCHPEPARTKLREMLRGQAANCYTIEKHGVKRLIYQAPWYNGGRYMGIVEMAIELPPDIPHHQRA